MLPWNFDLPFAAAAVVDVDCLGRYSGGAGPGRSLDVLPHGVVGLPPGQALFPQGCGVGW